MGTQGSLSETQGALSGTQGAVMGTPGALLRIQEVHLGRVLAGSQKALSETKESLMETQEALSGSPFRNAKSPMDDIEFFKKMILKVLTLRLFWGLKSLNFKTFFFK